MFGRLRRETRILKTERRPVEQRLGANDVLVRKSEAPAAPDYAALTEAIQAACPNCSGISAGAEGIVAHFGFNATAEERDAAREIIRAFDPKTKSRGAIEREARVSELRAMLGDEVTDALFRVLGVKE